MAQTTINSERSSPTGNLMGKENIPSKVGEHLAMGTDIRRISNEKEIPSSSYILNETEGINKVWSDMSEKQTHTPRIASNEEAFLLQTCEFCTHRYECPNFNDMGPWICDGFNVDRAKQSRTIATQWLCVLGSTPLHSNVKRVARKLMNAYCVEA